MLFSSFLKRTITSQFSKSIISNSNSISIPSTVSFTRNFNSTMPNAKPEQTSGNFADKDGHFKRKPSSFRNTISSEPGAEFPPEKGRYHLYVSLACPWYDICFKPMK